MVDYVFWRSEETVDETKFTLDVYMANVVRRAGLTPIQAVILGGEIRKAMADAETGILKLGVSASDSELPVRRSIERLQALLEAIDAVVHSKIP